MRNGRRWLADGLLAVNRLIGSSTLSRRAGSGSALVFAPHPDDEVLGCGGTIALKARAGLPVKVVVMTDGRTSHRGRIAPEALVALRRAEAERAALALGLTAGDYRFLDFEDQCLEAHHESARLRVGGLLSEFEPDQVFVPHRHDGTSDHVATYRIVRQAVAHVRSPVEMFEYPIWLWNGWPWTPGDRRHASGILRRTFGTARDVAALVLGCRVQVDVSGVQQRKLQALAEYRSQVQRYNGDPQWPVLSDVSDGEFLQRFRSQIEIFRRSDFRR